MKKILAMLMLVVAFAVLGTPDSYAGEKNKDHAAATAVFTVSPKMTCQNCEKKIKSNLRFEKGVKVIVTDVKAGTVTVTYLPKVTSVEKIISSFKKIGYVAIETTAETARGECAESKCSSCQSATGCTSSKACAKSQGKKCSDCAKNGTEDCCRNKKK